MRSVTARSSFCPFLCHCELRFFAQRSSLSSPYLVEIRDRFVASFLAVTKYGCHCEVVVSFPKQSLLSGVTASLVFSFGEAISDCFASLATAKNAAGLLRFARSDKKGDCFVASLLAVTKKKPSQ